MSGNDAVTTDSAVKTDETSRNAQFPDELRLTMPERHSRRRRLERPYERRYTDASIDKPTEPDPPARPRRSGGDPA